MPTLLQYGKASPLFSEPCSRTIWRIGSHASPTSCQKNTILSLAPVLGVCYSGEIGGDFQRLIGIVNNINIHSLPNRPMKSPWIQREHYPSWRFHHVLTAFDHIVWDKN